MFSAMWNSAASVHQPHRRGPEPMSINFCTSPRGTPLAGGPEHMKIIFRTPPRPTPRGVADGLRGGRVFGAARAPPLQLAVGMNSSTVDRATLPPGPRLAPPAQAWQWTRSPLPFLDS